MSHLNDPIKIGNVQLKNRVFMAPMQRWMGTSEGLATDYHINHYGSRAKGGVGLVIIESTAIAENGRLFQNDIGIFTDEHVEPMKKIVEAVHQHDTKVFIQLCHGGRKASPENKGRMIAPSAIKFDDNYGVPNEITPSEIQETKRQFVEAAKRAVQAGFDGIELHAAHGYLLHQFLSPLSNKRTDKYGGSLENRVRLIKEILISIRREVGNNYPVIIRVSASDYHPDGLTAEIVGEAMKMLDSFGIDAVHVSSGGHLPTAPDDVSPGYQVPYAETIKHYVSVPIIAVGKIHTKQLAEKVLEQEKAECIAVGSPLIEDPNFVSDWVSK